MFYYNILRGDFIQALMTPLFSTLLGACVGSFLNVCLFRWKNRGGIFTPPSFCPHCEKPIHWFDNIPVFSFLLLRGNCRHCHRSISWQYPLVEAATAVLFLASSLSFSEKYFLILGSFVFVGFLVLLVVSDIKWRLLPNIFNNLFILAGVLFRGGNVFLTAPNSFFKAVSGFIIIGSLVFAIFRFFPQGLGGGDIKMIAGLSIWLGVSKAMCVLLFAFGIGSIVVLPFLLRKKITLKSMIPFGPFLALGAMAVWFFPNLSFLSGAGQ